MFAIVRNKIRHKKWMVLSLLVGNILLIAIASASPLYMDAMLSRLLTRTMEDRLYETNKHPLMVTIDSGGTTPLGAQVASLRLYDHLADEMPAVYGLDTLTEVNFATSARLSMAPDVIRDDVSRIDLQLSTLSDLDEHAKILSGELYRPGIEETADGGVIVNAIIPQRTMVKQSVLLGDILTVNRNTSSTELLDRYTSLSIRVVGVFAADDASDPYWIRQESYYANHLFLDPETFDLLLRPGYQASLEGGDEVSSLVSVSGIWNIVFDYTSIKPEDVSSVRATNQQYTRDLNAKRTLFVQNFDDTLQSFEREEVQTKVTLTLLQVPVYLLLLAFIFMVSKQLLRMEQGEIAVFKSRGASRLQVMSIYMLQSLLIGLIALGIALPLSFLLTNMIGSADAFLSFVSREALPLRLQTSFLVASGIALATGFLTMIVPAFRLSKTTIVEQKQQLQELDQKTPLWQKLWLDVVLLLVGCYAYYSFNKQKDSIADRVAAGQGTDGLLFLSSSLFMVGMALVVWRILPLLLRLFYKLTEKLWGPAMYLSFLQTIRSRNRQAFISVFLMLTMSIGLFSAITARTINENAKSQIRYMNGTDVIVREHWSNNAEAVAMNSELELVYQEPDIGSYEQLDEVKSVARVYTRSDVEVRGRNVNVKDVSLMGIHTKEFGETVKLDSHLLPEHINTYLNQMAKDGHGVLLSENFHSKLGLEIGDRVYLNGQGGESVYGIVTGFVPYWPSYQPQSTSTVSDGSQVVTDNYLVVAHLSQVQSAYGIVPYDVWMRIDGDSRFLYDLAEDTREELAGFTTGVRFFTKFVDTNAELIDLNRDPILQGTNGLLTISYMVVLVLCAVGFLIYWILSIRSRTLLFGIFRAMGLRFKELILMLVNEQIAVTLPALAAGTGIGYLTARLYVPLILVAYGSEEQFIPLRILYAGQDFLRTFLIVGVTIILCLFVLVWQIRQINIASALKLGED